MPPDSGSITLLTGFLDLLEFLEFLASPRGLTAICSLVVYLGCQFICGWGSAIALLTAGATGLLLYQRLEENSL